MLEWLLEQAKTASPLFAVGCLAAVGVLWRQHIKDQRTIQSLNQSGSRAMTAVARAMTRLSTKIEAERGRSRR